MGGNWSVVGYPSDPIPDDPGVVAAQVEHIKAVTAALAAQLSQLPSDGQVDSIAWQSAGNSAPEQFKSVVKTLPKDLSVLHLRYQKVGGAMGTFQAALAQWKGQAQANLPLAVAAHQDILTAQNGIKAMNDFEAQARQAASTANAQAKPGTPPVTPVPWSGPDWNGALSDAQNRFQRASGLIHQAVQNFHSASQAAAHAVSAASNDSLKDHHSFWGSIGHALLSAAHWASKTFDLPAISKVLNDVTAALGVVALVVAVVPFIGPAVDVAIAGAMVAMSVAALACDVVDQLNNAYEGDFSWSNFGVTMGLDVVNTALSVAGFGFARQGVAAAAEVKTATAQVAEAEQAQRAAQWAAAKASLKDAVASKAVGLTTNGNRLSNTLFKVSGLAGKAQDFRAATSAGVATAEDNQWLAQAKVLEKLAKQGQAEAAQHAATVHGLQAGVAGTAGTGGGLWYSGQGSPAADAQAVGASIQAHAITLPAR